MHINLDIIVYSREHKKLRCGSLSCAFVFIIDDDSSVDCNEDECPRERAGFHFLCSWVYVMICMYICMHVITHMMTADLSLRRMEIWWIKITNFHSFDTFFRLCLCPNGFQLHLALSFFHPYRWTHRHTDTRTNVIPTHRHTGNR